MSALDCACPQHCSPFTVTTVAVSLKILRWLKLWRAFVHLKLFRFLSTPTATSPELYNQGYSWFIEWHSLLTSCPPLSLVVVVPPRSHTLYLKRIITRGRSNFYLSSFFSLPFPGLCCDPMDESTVINIKHPRSQGIIVIVLQTIPVLLLLFILKSNPLR